MIRRAHFPLIRALARRGYHHGNLKDALVEAARTLIAERGASGFTLAEAAKLAGVTPAAPYRHFNDRNALLCELARRGFDAFGARLGEAWSAGRPDPVAALWRMGEAYLDFQGRRQSSASSARQTKSAEARKRLSVQPA
jgi:AcrR family transcriptional regulator